MSTDTLHESGQKNGNNNMKVNEIIKHAIVELFNRSKNNVGNNGNKGQQFTETPCVIMY